MIRVLSRVLVPGTAALLAGCALLSTPDPVQLYRFGATPEPGSVAAPAASPVQVQLRRITFPSATRGDRILGVTGTEAAYIKGARWVSPAQDLYSDSLEAAFAARSVRVRLIGPRELTPSQRVLDVDIQTFEARYAATGTAPTVIVTATARLLSLPERVVVAERRFTVEQPAGANRVAAIVEAFDQASGELSARIVDWTDQNAG